MSALLAALVALIVVSTFTMYLHWCWERQEAKAKAEREAGR